MDIDLHFDREDEDDSEEDEEILLYLLLQRAARRRSKPRSIWIHPMNSSRKEEGMRCF